MMERRRRWHPLQCSCLENPMDGGAWWAAVHGVAKSRTWLSDFTFTFHFHALEKEMATHSSVLAWRIPGTGEPGGLPSMGSHRVCHDWSDLAAAVAYKEQKSRAHSSGGWNSKVMMSACWARSPFQVTNFPLCPHTAEGAKEFLGVSYKGANLIHGGFTLRIEEYFSVSKKKEILTFATTCMDLKGIMLSEGS